MVSILLYVLPGCSLFGMRIQSSRSYLFRFPTLHSGKLWQTIWRISILNGQIRVNHLLPMAISTSFSFTKNYQRPFLSQKWSPNHSSQKPWCNHMVYQWGIRFFIFLGPWNRWGVFTKKKRTGVGWWFFSSIPRLSSGWDHPYCCCYHSQKLSTTTVTIWFFMILWTMAFAIWQPKPKNHETLRSMIIRTVIFFSLVFPSSSRNSKK